MLPASKRKFRKIWKSLNFDNLVELKIWKNAFQPDENTFPFTFVLIRDFIQKCRVVIDPLVLSFFVIC